MVWELVSCGLWLLMHDSWSKHAFMQVISMHWTSTIIIIYLELGLSKSPSAQVKTMTNDPYPVSVKAHVENVFFNVSITKRRWKDQWHGLNVFFFCCSNNVKMQVYSAQTNKKKFCLRFWVSPSLASVSFFAKLAWLIIIYFFLDKDGKLNVTDPHLDCWYSSIGICAIQTRSIGALLRGVPHVVVAGILRFSSHRAEISVPWQLVPKEMCAIGQHTVSHCFSFCVFFFFLISTNLVSMQQKFRGKLIVFGSAVSDDIGNHIASVVFEYVNIFLYVFDVFFFIFFLLANDHFFYICWVLGSESHLAVFYWILRVTES